MALTKEQREEVVKKYRRGDLDTGSSEVQIALLTHRISDITQHFTVHKKDAQESEKCPLVQDFHREYQSSPKYQEKQPRCECAVHSLHESRYLKWFWKMELEESPLPSTP